MIRRLHLFALTTSAAIAASASAADRNYSVTDFNQVRVNGPYKVKLVTGVAPFARASGSTAALDGVALDMMGRVLTIRRNPSAPSGYPGQPAGPVLIEIGTHDLTHASVVGSGSIDISSVRGQTFNLVVEGSGSARIGQLSADQLKVWLAGSGSAALAGNAKAASFVVRGTASIDARQLTIKDAVIGSEGPAVISATVSNSAKVNANGVSEVTLEGNPACTVKASGSASVTGCQ
jgi:hypothetical protein